MVSSTTSKVSSCSPSGVIRMIMEIWKLSKPCNPCKPCKTHFSTLDTLGATRNVTRPYLSTSKNRSLSWVSVKRSIVVENWIFLCHGACYGIYVDIFILFTWDFSSFIYLLQKFIDLESQNEVLCVCLFFFFFCRILWCLFFVCFFELSWVWTYLNFLILYYWLITHSTGILQNGWSYFHSKLAVMNTNSFMNKHPHTNFGVQGRFSGVRLLVTI